MCLKCGTQLAHRQLERIRFHVRTRERPTVGMSVVKQDNLTDLFQNSIDKHFGNGMVRRTLINKPEYPLEAISALSLSSLKGPVPLADSVAIFPVFCRSAGSHRVVSF